MLFARAARLVETTDGQHAFAAQEALGMHFLGLFLKAADADARDAADHAGEIFRNHCTAEAHGLEIQAAAIA